MNVALHGILPVLKPKGWTSHDVVAFVRRLSKQKKVGHTGTLDPEVEGVLPLCLGKATRVAEYLQERPKRYRGSLVLGISTDTEDQTGQVLEKKAVSGVSREQVEEVFRRLVGEIVQTPPMYSAVKVGGKKLYELARAGKEVERPVRRVTVYKLMLVDMVPGEFPEIHFDVLCSKGTYIRTLCVDIGKALGFPAHMNRLVRTQSGPVSLEDCLTLSEVEALARSGDWSRGIMPMDACLGHLPAVVVAEEETGRVLDGMSLVADACDLFRVGQIVRVYSESGTFLALCRMDSNGVFKPEKVFRDVE
jgi:tRNA pseudouridine55 synthase